jgi:hypothetical protein
LQLGLDGIADVSAKLVTPLTMGSAFQLIGWGFDVVSKRPRRAQAAAIGEAQRLR